MRPVLGKVKYHVDKLVWENIREKALEGDNVGNCRVTGHVQPWFAVELV